jgi:hypothetical protein
MRRALPLLFLPLGLGLAACGGESETDAGVTPDAGFVDSGPKADAEVPDSGPADSGVEPDAGFLDGGDPDAGVMDGGGPIDSPDCDPLMPEVCALPWPSNLYLEPTEARATGYTLAFGATTLPANNVRVHVDPTPYRRMDGYGVGTPIMVLFPDLDASQLPDETDIGGSLDADAEILLFEDDSKFGLVRVPYFAELDRHETDGAKRLLFVRPAVVLKEDTRYVVAIRNLMDTSGALYPRSAAFEAYVDGSAANDPKLSERAVVFTALLQQLADEGVETASLQLAWDFHTASCEALHGSMLHMRDDALATVDAALPTPVITSVTEYIPAEDGSGRPVDPDLWFRVEGDLTVPSYLETKLIGLFSSTVLDRDADGLPVQTGTRTMHFWMSIPHSARTSTTSLVIYGHGLLGRGDQTLSGYNRPVANQGRFIYVGASLTGFDEDMLTPVGVSLREMSAFEWVADTIHQGMAEYLMLARIMRGRIGGLQVIQENDIQVDTSEVFYSGISQGGIFGTTFMALSTDVERGHLGVPGSNYSLLLSRSVDFDPFFEMLATSYPSPISQALLLTGIEQLWETTDPVSYLRHVTQEPFPNTPDHRVLMAPAKGDYQVAPLSNEILARTELGIPIMENYDDERTVYGVSYAPYPRQGSGIVLWDFGNPWPTPGNRPPMDELGDPHGLPRRYPAHVTQLIHFLRTGEIIDVCGGDGCHPD